MLGNAVLALLFAFLPAFISPVDFLHYVVHGIVGDERNKQRYVNIVMYTCYVYISFIH